MIVGIDIRRANDALRVDDKPPRHRQGPTSFAVAQSEVISKAEIDLFEIIRKREPKTKRKPQTKREPQTDRAADRAVDRDTPTNTGPETEGR